MTISVSEATTVDDRLVEAFERLVPQLSKSSAPPGADLLQEMVDAPGTVLLVAENGNQIVGSLTLILFRIPTGLRAWIEDVVVDEAVRGQGVGARLNEAAIDRAAEAGAKTIDLTSRPARESANRLYQRLGFEQRNTFVYRFTPS